MQQTMLQSIEAPVLAGIIGGVLLALFASTTLPTDFTPVDLVNFVAIPLVAGAFVGSSGSQHSGRDGVLVGSILGLAYVAISVTRMASLQPASIFLFLILSVPVWGLLGGTGVLFFHRIWTTSPAKPVLPPRTCTSCATSNPPDALFCKNCGTKLP